MPEQPNLFTTPPKPPKFEAGARTLRKFAVDRAREEGAVSASACEAAAVRKGFDAEGAGLAILTFLRRHGSENGEALVNIAKGEGFIPADDRAYGGVFARLRAKGLIRCIGIGARAKGHGTSGSRVWEAVGNLSVAVDCAGCANPVASATTPPTTGNFQAPPADRRGITGAHG